jgi:predicted aspartyl protease
MLDTGASITSVDVNKVQNLKVIRKNIPFHTAGGIIHKNIYEAKEFKVADISLSNFSITGTHFSGKYSDGLLGMNFLGNFKFKIDQQEAILYLGMKRSSIKLQKKK